MNDINRKNPVESVNPSNDDEIIDLTRVVKTGTDNKAGGQTVDEDRQMPGFEDESNDFDEDDMDLGQLVADVVGGSVSDAGIKPSESVTIPIKNLEEVLEKVLQKAYSDKIEMMVINMVEKTLKAEIEKINTLIRKIAHESGSADNG